MKLILTGPAGFIGHEILTQCLALSSITSVVALTRRELPGSVANNPKLKVVVINDFLSYPDSVLQELKDSDACIWALGKARMPDDETARKVSVDYTLTAARIFSQNALSQQGKKFRFVYLSGGLAERDQTKPLWFAQSYRRIRGEVENQLLSYAKDYPDTFESYITRPGMVLTKGGSALDLIRGMGPSVKVDVLARATVSLALNGDDERVFENAMINRFGT